MPFQKETEKQLRLEKQGQMLSAAEKHYQDFLLNKRGLQPWRKVIEISKQNMKVTLSNTLEAWRVKLWKDCSLKDGLSRIIQITIWYGKNCILNKLWANENIYNFQVDSKVLFHSNDLLNFHE